MSKYVAVIVRKNNQRIRVECKTKEHADSLVKEFGGHVEHKPSELSLNINQPTVDMVTKHRATRAASWALHWLNEALWLELRRGFRAESGSSVEAAAANVNARTVHGLLGNAASMPLLIANALYAP